ncbi:Elongator subunit elp2 [Cryptotrichosporon argae]
MSASTPYIAVGANRASSCSARAGSILAYGAGRFVALWDLDGEDGVFATLRGHEGRVTVLKGLGQGFVSGDDAGGVRVWAKRGESWQTTATYAINGSVSALGVWDEQVFVGGSDGIISRVHGGDVEKLDLKGRIALDLEVVRLPRSTSPLLVVGCTDHKIQLWSQQAGHYGHALSLEGHEDWVRCLAATTSGDDVLLASGSQDSYVRLWRIARASGQPGQEGSDGPKGSGLDILDDLERLAADGSTQISTKAHVLSVDRQRYHISLDALLIGHEGGLTNVHWSPVSSSPSPSSSCSSSASSPALLSASSDNSLIIWTPTATVIPSASAGRDGIWVPAHRFGTFGGRGLGFFGAVWGPGAHSVVATGWAGGIERWDRADADGAWESRRGLTGHHGEVQAVAWDPNGDYLLSVSSDQTARVHARATGSWAEIARPQIHGYDMVDAAFLSPLRFASAADEKVTRVFDATTGFAQSLGALGVAHVEDAAALPKGATVPALGLSNRALGQASTQPEIRSASAVARDVVATALAAIPTEDELAGTTLWPEIEKVYGHGYELSTLSASHDGRLLATASRATSAEHAGVRLVDTATWDTVAVLAGHTLTVTRIVWSPDDGRVVTVSRDRGWRMYARADGQWAEVSRDERAHARMALDACWSPDGARFFTASRDKTVKVWNADGGALDVIKLDQGVTAVDAAQGENSDVLAIGTDGGRVEIWGIREGKATLLFRLADDISHVAAVNRLAWQPHREAGTYQLASASDDGSVRVFDVRLP